jgi:hypothetical protein
MTLDGNDGGGWVPGQSGTDPNGSGSIDDAPTASPQNIWDQALIDTLREVRELHKQAIKSINGFIQKAKANRDGSTPVPADAQKFNTSNTLKRLHTQLSTRVLTAEDRAILLDHALEKLRELKGCHRR